MATGLTAGTNYGFAIKAINIVGASDLSSLKVIMSATVPDAPSTPVMVSQSETQITVSWSPSSNNGGSLLTQFKLYWSKNSYASPVQTLNSETTSISVTDAMGVTTGEIYSFYVIATNFIGDSV